MYRFRCCELIEAKLKSLQRPTMALVLFYQARTKLDPISFLIWNWKPAWEYEFSGKSKSTNSENNVDMTEITNFFDYKHPQALCNFDETFIKNGQIKIFTIENAIFMGIEHSFFQMHTASDTHCLNWERKSSQTHSAAVNVRLCDVHTVCMLLLLPKHRVSCSIGCQAVLYAVWDVE